VDFVALFVVLGVLLEDFAVFELVAFVFLVVLDFLAVVFLAVLFLLVLFFADFVLVAAAFFVLVTLLLETEAVDAFTTGVVVTKYPVKIKQAKAAAKKLIFNFINFDTLMNNLSPTIEPCRYNKKQPYFLGVFYEFIP
jgi:hypothetical protein